MYDTYRSVMRSQMIIHNIKEVIRMDPKEIPTQNNTELKDEELADVNAGMKLALIKTPKFFGPLLRLIFKIRKKESTK